MLDAHQIRREAIERLIAYTGRRYDPAVIASRGGDSLRVLWRQAIDTALDVDRPEIDRLYNIATRTADLIEARIHGIDHAAIRTPEPVDLDQLQEALNDL